MKWYWWAALLGGVGWLVLESGAASRVRQLASELGSRFTNLRPEMQRAAMNVIDSLAQQGITVGIPSTGGWRSPAEEQAIDPANTRVVDPLDSYHVWGLAVDFVPIDGAGQFYWPPSTDPVWQVIGRAIQAAGLTWGGTFHSIVDMPHGELHLADLATLKSTYSDPMQFIGAAVA